MSQNFTQPFRTGDNTTKGMFGNFNNNKYVKGPREFLSSNTLVAKVVFLILVVILFVYILRFGIFLMSWLLSPSQSPKLVKGMKDARKFRVVTQNPNLKHSIPILRSRGQRGGLEFTWSIWINISDLQYKQGQKKHIFHKGSEQLKSGVAFPNNGPGMYLHETRNTIIIMMNTFSKMIETIEINDIPLNKWINLAVRVKGHVMDVFVNGRLALRHVLSGVPKQNYGDVYVNMNGGFSGSVSDLWYHDRGLTGTEIMEIVNMGPDLNTTDYGIAIPPYLSLKWFFENDQVASGTIDNNTYTKAQNI